MGSGGPRVIARNEKEVRAQVDDTIHRRIMGGTSLSFLGDSLVLPPSLESVRGVLGIQEIVPPAEAARVVADELLMVEIMVISPGPEREEVVETPGKLITTVRIDGLEQAQHNPDVHGEDVQVAGEGTPKNRTSHRTEAKNHDLDR